MAVRTHSRRAAEHRGRSAGRSAEAPQRGLAGAVLHLQRTAGNQAVQRQITKSQPSAFTELVAKEIRGLRKGDGLDHGTEDRKSRVHLLQRKLNDRLPGVALNADGMFGPLTAKALHRVQERNDLPVEDVVSHDASIAVAEDGYFDFGRRVVWDPSFWSFKALRTSTRQRQEVNVGGKVAGFAFLRPQDGDKEKLDITMRLHTVELHGEAGGRKCDIENGQGTLVGDGSVKDGSLLAWMSWINLDGQTPSNRYIHFTDGRGAIVGHFEDSPNS